MSKQAVLSQTVAPVTQRRLEIEKTALPPNLGAFLDNLVEEVPDSVALHLIESGEALTYAELRARVNQVANGLRHLGVRKGAHIGVMLPNIKEFPIAWLAIAKVGAVMVPINIRYTSRELHYVLDDSEADYLIILADLLPLFEEVANTLPRLPRNNVIVCGASQEGYGKWDHLTEFGEQFTAEEPVGPNDLLNIQYTSGTTGFPKGCMLSHDYWLIVSKVNAARDGRCMPNVMASTPFFYMDPQWLMLMAFHQRGTLFLAPRQSASRFMDWVRQYRINFCLMPNVILKQPESPLDRDNDLIKVSIYGFPSADQAALEARFDVVAREAFGMTEIGSCLFVPIEATDMVGSGTCGIPSPFRECRIVDGNGNDVPEGDTGELVVRGRGILQGYYRKPDATSEAFFGEWFRTGDLFTRDENGFYYIVGRVKDMIRRAGENIAAREVEAVVSVMPEVAEAAAIPVPDDTRGEEVKIYVVPRSGRNADDLTPERVIAHCAQQLASFKVPRYVEFRSELPKTPSDKVAKHLLKAEKTDLRQGSWDRVEGRWL
ncbi:class I adenylate-forming enzyme family protein [Rhodoligotrophos ferricapiens]|uniref:class I adenylate-forming enzyme family protein n=1 Tax=Rhodoligotrophos ferricapiens TaxID=3069264 RepID=UPI00315DDE5F